MTIKVSDVMRHVRNHLISSACRGTFRQQNGVLTLADGLPQPGYFAPEMWVAIVSKDGPQGVFQLTEQAGLADTADTTFTGTVYVLNPPADFIRLCGDIACWAQANPDPAVSSEKLGEYSINRRAVTWESAFALALNPYRRMYSEVRV